MIRRPPRRRTELLLLAAMLASLMLIRGASAHIDVLPNTVPAGILQAFNVRVPNEKEEPTVSVLVEFPSGLIVSRFQPKPGWQRDLEKDSAGRITAVIWSGGQIGVGEYEDFTFLARTPREPGKLSWKAYQTYQGGETVAWVGAEGEELPAPVVEVVAGSTETGTNSTSIEEAAPAVSTEQSGAAAPPAPTVPAQATSEEPTAPPPTREAVITGVPALEAGAVDATLESAAPGSDLALFTALGALITALVALAVAGVALARRRSVP